MSEIKLNGVALRVGQWWGNGNTMPWRIEDLYAPRNTIWYRHHDRDAVIRASVPMDADPPLRLLSPAELSAAGIADEQRLAEQKVWREGVTLYQYPSNFGGHSCWIHIDGRPAGYGGGAEGFIESIGPLRPEDTTDVSDKPTYSDLFCDPRLRDFVAKFRAERAKGSGVLKWRDFVYRSVDGIYYFWSDRDRHWVNTTALIDDMPTATTSQLAQSGVPLSDIPDAQLREEVRRIRQPVATLPDGSVMEVGEMYVSNRGWLQRILIEHVTPGLFQRDYFDPNCRRWMSGLPVDVSGACSIGLNCLARLATAADIPPEVDIGIVPRRIRAGVEARRAAAKWGEIAARWASVWQPPSTTLPATIMLNGETYRREGGK